MSTATKIYQLNNVLSTLGSKFLATLSEYKEGKNRSDVIFEKLRPWQKIELSEGVFELDLNLNPIEIPQGASPKIKELEKRLNKLQKNLDYTENHELAVARGCLESTDEWTEVQRLQEELSFAQKKLEQRPEYREVEEWQAIADEQTANLKEAYQALETARNSTIRTAILTYFEVRNGHNVGTSETMEWQPPNSRNYQWILAPKDSPQFKQVVEWNSQIHYVCSEEGRTFDGSWVLAASYDKKSLWEKAERTWQTEDYQPLTTVQEAVNNTPNGWLKSILERTVGSRWIVSFNLDKFLNLNWQRYDAGVNHIGEYRYYQALTEDVLGYQKAGFLFDFEEKDLNQIELVDGKHGKELVSDLIQPQPARQAYLIIGNGSELGVDRDVLVTAYPGIFGTSINAMEMADHTVQDLYTYACTYNTPFIVKAR